MTSTRTTDRPAVRIRPIELADGPLIEQFASDLRISATSHVPHPYPPGGGTVFATRAINEWRDGGDRTFAVLSAEAFAGVVSLMAVNRPIARAQIGYWIAVHQWGKGIATEAVRLVSRCAFEDLGLRELGAGCLAENIASARVLEKAGFNEGIPFTYRGPDRRFQGRTIRTFTLHAPVVEAAG